MNKKSIKVNSLKELETKLNEYSSYSEKSWYKKSSSFSFSENGAVKKEGRARAGVVIKNREEELDIYYEIPVDEMNESIEKELNKALNLKENHFDSFTFDSNNNDSEKKEQEINQLKKEIKGLENSLKDNQRDLESKKKQLEDLEKFNRQSNNEKGKNNWLKPILIVGVISIVSLTIYLIISKKCQKKKVKSNKHLIQSK
ncbi:MAG: ATP-dependent zinc metalloprotease FtsH [Mycoplasmataceae bacterium]|nr:MAG: ATP-dependent zinc metalloprotease FtsH [Mycoplasmataceae bacterium]